MNKEKIEITAKNNEQFEALNKVKEALEDNYDFIYDDSEGIFYLDDKIGIYTRNFRTHFKEAKEETLKYCEEDKVRYMDFIIKTLYFIKILPFGKESKAIYLPAVKTTPQVEQILNAYSLKCQNISIDFDKKRFIINCIPDYPLFFTQSLNS